MKKKFLVLTDFSSCAEAAYEFAKEHLKNWEAEGELVAVFEDNYPTNIAFGFGISAISTEGLYEEFSGRAHQRLQEEIAKNFPNLQIRPKLLRAKGETVAQVIVNYAEKERIDGIILSTHGRGGIKRFVLGSVAEEIVRYAHCPVFVVPSSKSELVIKPADDSRPNIILLSDLSAEAETAFVFAKKELETLNHLQPQLNILHVVEDIFAATYHANLGSDVEAVWRDLERQAEEQLDTLKNKYFSGSLALSTIIRQNNRVAEEIVTFAEARHARLLILATHGRKGFRHAILGSVAERVVRSSSVPVMVVPVKESINT